MSKPSYLPRFSHPSSLREFNPADLITLVRPHAEFLINHGLPVPDNPGELDIERLGVVLLQPLADTPPDLVDALSHIHEMATADGMETLTEEVRSRGLPIPLEDTLSPSDLALRVWVHDPRLLRRKHAEHVVLKRSSFDAFLPRNGASFVRPSEIDAAVRSFEEDVSKWFIERGRGRGVHVHPIVQDDEVRLVVRHGGPYRREGCLNENEPGTIQFRPLGFHFLVLDFDAWELRVNCKTKGETQLYREAIGERFFGQRDFFDERSRKYTLEPLRTLGRRALNCADIHGIRVARLVELAMFLGGPFGRRRIEQADDVLLALEDAGERIPHNALLTKGKLEIEFTDSRKPRIVSFTSINRARYTRGDDDCIVEQFLRRRGFILGADRAAVACA